MSVSPFGGHRDVFPVEIGDHGCRLDVFLAAHLPQYSRTHLRRAIDAGSVQVDGVRTKVAYRLVAGQQVTVSVPELPATGPQPEDFPLDILFEDDQLVAINKPPGMVVHPAKGNWSGTLASGLVHHFQSLSSVGGPTRPGIVHRLDRDTSGVIVVAKSDIAHRHVAEQFEGRTVQKQYVAICRGVPDRDRDRIVQPIGPHPGHRERMAIRARHATSRDARTDYEVHTHYRGFSYLNVFPKTGRTHQIRVHLTHIGCPVVCDRLYGGHAKITLGEINGSRDDGTVVLDRQALHAQRIGLQHPTTGESLTLEAPLPPDIVRLLEALATHRS